MNKKIIIGNHKNYMTTNEVNEYLKKINDKVNNKLVIICPSNIYIPYFLKKDYSVGIQNINTNLVATGEITNEQALSLGIKYAIIGHSERRTHFDENDSYINKKVIESLKYGMKVILCIGESLEEKNMLKTAKIIKKQLREDLKNIDNFKNIIIAYEPIWAIGTNIVPTNRDISKTALYIREVIKEIYNIDSIKILYGGSVNSLNIKEINEINEIDGVLVGKASTDAEEFLKIIEVVSN